MKTMLTTIQLWVLNDIVEILRIPYLAQEALSSEHTPTLSIALPTYKLMLSGWWNLEKKFPNLKPAIQARLSKIEDYVAKARKSKIYTLEIVLNPRYKLAWVERQWGTEAKQARDTVEAVMLEYRQAYHLSTSSATMGSLWSNPVSVLSTLATPTTCAAQSQVSALSKLRMFSLDFEDNTPPLASSHPQEVNSAICEAKLDEED
ncbi:hypothetical protein FRB93_001194 [Tulasnella sp. JGI-2019a]|nr:hypothetical protein FRB93_001194 [Tulasnella sp. JGI-2019a]